MDGLGSIFGKLDFGRLNVAGLSLIALTRGDPCRTKNPTLRSRWLNLGTWPVILAIAALFLPKATMADPPTINSDVAYEIDLASGIGTFSIVTNGLVAGGVRPLEIRPGSIVVQPPSSMSPFVTLTRVGRLCIAYDIDFGDGDNPEQPFTIAYVVDGANGEFAAGSIDFVQGPDGPILATPDQCGDPENLAPTPQETIRRSMLDTDDPLDVSVVVEGVDEYPDGLAVSIEQPPPAIGVAEVVGQQIRFSPREGQTGPAIIRYRLTDPEGKFGEAEISIEVSSAGLPVVREDQADTDPDVAVDIDVLFNDDPGVALLTVPEFSQRDGTLAIVFNASANRDVIRYTPPSGFIGSDSFVYTITGGNSASVSITVGDPVNRPVAIDDQESVDPGQSVVISVLTNDRPDPSILTIASVTQPENGAAVINEGNQTITYTPATGFSGDTDTFTYTVSDGNPSTLDSLPATVTVTVGLTLTSFARNPTQSAVASSIDVVCPALGRLNQPGQPPLPSASLELLDRCAALIAQAEQEDEGNSAEGGVSDALQQIAGEELLASGTSAVTIANLQTSNIGSRIASLRGGSRGISLGGLALSIEGKQLPSAVMANILPESPGNGGGSSGDEPSPWSRLGVFVNGSWNFGDKDETDLEAGFDFDTYGVTAGLDYRFTDRMILGLAVGYSDASVDFDSDAGSLDSDALTFTAYGTYFAEQFYIDFSAGLGDVDFDATRALVFSDTRGGVNSLTQGSTNGDQTSLSLSTGYNFGSDGWTIGPYVAINYLKLDIDGFVEAEPNVEGDCRTVQAGLCGSGWALAYDDQDLESVIASGGLRVSRVVSSKWGVFIPHFRATFLNEFEDDAQVVRARFAHDPTGTTFEFRSDELDSSFYQFAGGFSFVTKAGFSGFVDYEVLAGYDNLTSSTLTAGVRYQRAFR